MSERDQVPGMPHAICHACGLGYKCMNPKCPNDKPLPSPPSPAPAKAGEYGELVKELRVPVYCWAAGKGNPDHLHAKAADAIEALTAERDEWKRDATTQYNMVQQAYRRFEHAAAAHEEAEARVAELEKALAAAEYNQPKGYRP